MNIKRRKRRRKCRYRPVYNLPIGLFVLLLLFCSGTEDKQKPLVSKGNLTAAQRISSMYGTAVVLIINEGRFGATSGIGSGFVIDKKGIIVTSNHCVEGAHTLSVKFRTEDFPRIAKVIAKDKDSDIAILKIGKPAPVAVTLGNSDKITIGEKIVVIATPQGQADTVSDGKIRSIIKGDKLQITTPLSKGSSGSPVFNMQGQVIGMVFGIPGQNLNFAVRINKIKELLPAQTVAVESPVESKLQQESTLKITESKGNKSLKDEITEEKRDVDNILKKLAEKDQPQRSYEEGRGVSKGSAPVKNADGSITSTTPWRDGRKTIDTRIGSNTEVVRPDPQAYGKVYALINSKVFHRPECSAIQGEKVLMTFNSRAEALKYRAEPCLVCSP